MRQPLYLVHTRVRVFLLFEKAKIREIFIRAIPNEEKKHVIVFVVKNLDFFCHDSRQKDHESRHGIFSLVPEKIKSRFEIFCRGLIYA